MAEEKSRCAVEDAKQLPFFVELDVFWMLKAFNASHLRSVPQELSGRLTPLPSWFLSASGLLHQKTVIFRATYSRGSVRVAVNYSIICLTNLKMWKCAVLQTSSGSIPRNHLLLQVLILWSRFKQCCFSPLEIRAHDIIWFDEPR